MQTLDMFQAKAWNDRVDSSAFRSSLNYSNFHQQSPGSRPPNTGKGGGSGGGGGGELEYKIIS